MLNGGDAVGTDAYRDTGPFREQQRFVAYPLCPTARSDDYRTSPGAAAIPATYDSRSFARIFQVPDQPCHERCLAGTADGYIPDDDHGYGTGYAGQVPCTITGTPYSDDSPV
jgi:hypothetical protein